MGLTRIPAAAVILMNEAGEVLMLKRRTDDRSFNGWGFPGGKSDEGEDSSVTAIRETAEETGISITGPEPLFIHDTVHSSRGRIYTTQLFRVDVPNGAKVTLSDEHTEFRWVNPKKALKTLELAGPMTQLGLRYVS